MVIDKLEAYTYNKSTVWFLSTPILILSFPRMGNGPQKFLRLFFYLYGLVSFVGSYICNYENC